MEGHFILCGIILITFLREVLLQMLISADQLQCTKYFWKKWRKSAGCSTYSLFTSLHFSKYLKIITRMEQLQIAEPSKVLVIHLRNYDVGVNSDFILPWWWISTSENIWVNLSIAYLLLSHSALCVLKLQKGLHHKKAFLTVSCLSIVFHVHIIPHPFFSSLFFLKTRALYLSQFKIHFKREISSAVQSHWIPSSSFTNLNKQK